MHSNPASPINNTPIIQHFLSKGTKDYFFDKKGVKLFFRFEFYAAVRDPTLPLLSDFFDTRVRVQGGECDLSIRTAQPILS
jgi:hypothetical protein